MALCVHILYHPFQFIITEIYSNDSEDRSSSPVIIKENIRKRGKTEIPGKVLRKRKK